MSDRQGRLLGYLSDAAGWVTAAELADRFRVSTRSVRSYVTAVKAATSPFDVVESSTSGYRLDRAAYGDFLVARGTEAGADRPKDRTYHLLRRLGDAEEPMSVHVLAASMFVSESTVEADLRRLRTALQGTGLALVRKGDTVRIDGPEEELRRQIGRMFQDEETQGFLELASIEREFASSDLREFKTRMIAMLDGHGYLVNEYGLNNVLLHVAITVDRTARERRGRPREAASRETADDDAGIADELGALVLAHFDTTLATEDLDYLGTLLTTRVITRGYTEAADPETTRRIEHELSTVRMIVERVAEEYVIDLDDEDFVVRLALHLSNLLARARGNSYSRNPMSRSIKTGYPMVYELAVFIASEFQRVEDVVINDDEISYIALHVGSHLERRAQREERVTCAIVCPNYYDLQLVLRQRIEALLGDELQVEVVITRTDVDWEDIATGIVITTIESPVAGRSNIVTIGPFITEADVDAIRRTVSRVRRHDRRTRLTEELLVFFDEQLFLRDVDAPDRDSMIRLLGRRMIDAGVISEEYVDGAIEREAMSSTAFTDALAVPHAMTMTAVRTAICLAVNQTPIDWGESRVNVVALIAFSASDRERFQAVFDQFVSVFADPIDAQRLVRRGADLPSFIDELVRAVER